MRSSYAFETFLPRVMPFPGISPIKRNGPPDEGFRSPSPAVPTAILPNQCRVTRETPKPFIDIYETEAPTALSARFFAHLRATRPTSSGVMPVFCRQIMKRR